MQFKTSKQKRITILKYRVLGVALHLLWGVSNLLIVDDLKVPSRWKTTIKVLFLYYVLPCIYYDFVSCTFTPYSFIIFLHLVNKLYVLINVLFRFPKKSLIDAFCVIAMRTINFEDDIIQYGIQEIDFLLKHYGEEKVYINWLP